MDAVIVDYNVGNIFSMNKALIKAGFKTSVTSDSSEIMGADAIILPGVGNFGAAASRLEPLSGAVRGAVDAGVPMLGVCLGMQLLFERSEEGDGEGLGILRGGVVKFSGNLKIPHMGWNDVKAVRDCEILDGVDGGYFYFVHSYYAEPSDPGVAVAVTEYGSEFPSVVSKDGVYGTQFHPEKSGDAGSRVLRNFARLIRR